MHDQFDKFSVSFDKNVDLGERRTYIAFKQVDCCHIVDENTGVFLAYDCEIKDKRVPKSMVRYIFLYSLLYLLLIGVNTWGSELVYGRIMDIDSDTETITLYDMYKERELHLTYEGHDLSGLQSGMFIKLWITDSDTADGGKIIRLFKGMGMCDSMGIQRRLRRARGYGFGIDMRRGCRCGQGKRR